MKKVLVLLAARLLVAADRPKEDSPKHCFPVGKDRPKVPQHMESVVDDCCLRSMLPTWIPEAPAFTTMSLDQ